MKNHRGKLLGLGLVLTLAALACGSSGGGDSLGAGEENNTGTGTDDAGSNDATTSPQLTPPPDAGLTSRDTGTSSTEVCGNGLDDNHNGHVDEGCHCASGTSQPCYPGDPATIDQGVCKKGTQTCQGTGEFAVWGECTGAVVPTPEQCDGVDSDCDGKVDDVDGGCEIDVPINIDGDCVTVSCPAKAPYPVGCQLDFAGGDSRGCVANVKNKPTVFLKEGDECGAGHVSGKLKCSSVPGSGLNASTCPINKSDRYYVTSSGACP